MDMIFAFNSFENVNMTKQKQIYIKILKIRKRIQNKLNFPNVIV